MQQNTRRRISKLILLKQKKSCALFKNIKKINIESFSLLVIVRVCFSLNKQKPFLDSPFSRSNLEKA